MEGGARAGQAEAAAETLDGAHSQGVHGPQVMVVPARHILVAEVHPLAAEGVGEVEQQGGAEQAHAVDPEVLLRSFLHPLGGKAEDARGDHGQEQHEGQAAARLVAAEAAHDDLDQLLPEVDHQGQQGAQVQQHIKGQRHGPAMEHQVLGQGQVRRGGHRQEFRQALDQSQEDGV